MICSYFAALIHYNSCGTIRAVLIAVAATFINKVWLSYISLGQLFWFKGLWGSTITDPSLASSFTPIIGILAAYLVLEREREMIFCFLRNHNGSR